MARRKKPKGWSGEVARHSVAARKGWKNRKRVGKWADGDSGYLSDGTPFRLARVRAPEKHQYGGSTATRTAAGMTGRTKGYVNVKQVARDRYGRSVVEMRNREGSINDRMRKKGYKKKGR